MFQKIKGNETDSVLPVKKPKTAVKKPIVVTKKTEVDISPET